MPQYHSVEDMDQPGEGTIGQPMQSLPNLHNSVQKDEKKYELPKNHSMAVLETNFTKEQRASFVRADTSVDRISIPSDLSDDMWGEFPKYNYYQYQ